MWYRGTFKDELAHSSRQEAPDFAFECSLESLTCIRSEMISLLCFGAACRIDNCGELLILASFHVDLPHHGNDCSDILVVSWSNWQIFQPLPKCWCHSLPKGMLRFALSTRLASCLHTQSCQHHHDLAVKSGQLDIGVGPRSKRLSLQTINR